MNFRTYYFGLDKAARTTFAQNVESTVGHLNNVAYGYRPPATVLAVAIERVTGGAVSRQELRPADYWKRWPDLSPPAATVIACEAGEGAHA